MHILPHTKGKKNSITFIQVNTHGYLYTPYMLLWTLLVDSFNIIDLYISKKKEKKKEETATLDNIWHHFIFLTLIYSCNLYL